MVQFIKLRPISFVMTDTVALLSNWKDYSDFSSSYVATNKHTFPN